MTDYHNPAWTKESRFRGSLDDVIIIPLVVVALAANKILRFILSILMRLLDYAFPLAMQIVWLPPSRQGSLAMSSFNCHKRRVGVLFPFPRRIVGAGAYRSAGTGRGFGGRSAIRRSNELCIPRLRAAWHACSGNAGISRRTPHCS